MEQLAVRETGLRIMQRIAVEPVRTDEGVIACLGVDQIRRCCVGKCLRRSTVWRRVRTPLETVLSKFPP